jgi:hypothetical protein
MFNKIARVQLYPARYPMERKTKEKGWQKIKERERERERERVCILNTTPNDSHTSQLTCFPFISTVELIYINKRVQIACQKLNAANERRGSEAIRLGSVGACPISPDRGTAYLYGTSLT